MTISRAACAATLAGGLSLSLSGCGNADAAKAAAPPAGAESEVGSVVTGAKRSQHFDAVAQHLDLGGTLYGYFDIDGDVEKVASLLQGFLDIAKEEAGDSMPPHIRDLDLSKVLAELGFDGIEAVGMSSIKKGDLYLNKAYAHIPAGRKGLLKVLGGDAEPFVAKQLAPADSDLIWEQSINLKAGFDVVTAMVMRFGGPDVLEQFEAATGEVNPQIGLSIAEVFGGLDTRFTVVGRVHPDKPLEIPDAPIKFPSFDLLIALDDAGWLFDKLIAKGKEEVPEDLIQAAVKDSPMGAAEVAITSLLDRALPDSNRSQASVTVNTPEGILMVSNAASSYKDAFVMGGVGMLAGVGGSLAVRSKSSIPFDEPLEIEAIPDLLPPEEENENP